uniref:Uncharacterized protein n=1 Tax=Rhizophora mucronata TaxID=61149 RepID=A0A2P2PY03_RHIMU
MAVTRPPLTLN